MKLTELKYQPPIVWIVIAMHILWIALILSGNHYDTIGIGSLLLVFHDSAWGAVIALIVTIGVSSYGLMFHPPAFVRAMCLIPQNILMACVTAGVIWFALHGMYADGTQRSALFIISDQFPYITMLVSHTVALLQWTRWL
ncbi:MAG: hypothetical protein KGL39_49625 [Patescibacteria group bacterium]|nr:hypothetical protein [Patescibacteria group bacterium]